MIDNDPKNYVGLVAKTARRLWRNPSLRASRTIEDLEQELWLVWMRAIESYDAERGAGFETYFYVAATNRARAMSLHGRRQCRQAMETSTSDLEEMNIEIEDDGSVSAEDHIDGERYVSKALSLADPRLGAILRLMLSDSELLGREDQALRAKARLAREMGTDKAETGIQLPALFKLVGVSKARGYRMIGELKEAMNGHSV